MRMTDLTQLRQMGLFDARVPRYTSYPTAPQFSDRVRAPLVEGWLAAIAPGATVSLYVHVPFCRRLCWFCACRTQGTSTGQPVAAYVDRLLDELRLVTARLPRGVKLSRLHWGGGTPTLMAPEQMQRLAGAIAAALPFAEGAEFSVEIDPNEIDDARLDALAAAGMNRASIGVQDFHPEIQKAIGRQQSYELTAQAVEMIRARGVASLNMDLLYGLPYQTVERITEGTEKVISLLPDRVALYGYAHVPWMARRQNMIPAEALPPAEERLDLAKAAERLFVAAGYQAIGIDHFARPDDGLARAAAEGRLRRNFQGYTDDQAPTLIGIGASSISRYAQGYAQNAPATGAWSGIVQNGELPVTKGYEFKGQDRLRGRIIEALMCDFRADLAAIAAETGATRAEALALTAGLAEQFPGTTAQAGDVLIIQPWARALTRIIARHFDEYAVQPAGYSQAI